MTDEENTEEKEGQKVEAEKPKDSTITTERLELATRKLQKERHKLEEKLALLEEEKANQQLQGTSEAGIKEEKKEETPKEYAARIMKGDV